MGLVFFEGMLWSSMKKLLFMVCPNHVLLCFVSYQLWCLVVVWSRCGFTSNYVCNVVR